MNCIGLNHQTSYIGKTHIKDKRMIRYLYIVFIAITAINCKNEIENNHQTPNEKSVSKSESQQTILAETIGDLDNDGIDEKIIVYHTDKVTDFGKERKLCFYKKNKGNWELWKESIGAVLPSEHGGVFGDPFVGIVIEENNIRVNHFGGSSTKWYYQHNYKLVEGEFKLTNFRIQFGSHCPYIEKYSCDLSTGKFIHEKEIGNCDSNNPDIIKKEAIYKISKLPKMNGFYPGDNKIDLPNISSELYY